MTPIAVIDLQFNKRPDGLLEVTSPDVPGLFLCSDDVEALVGDIEPALKLLLKGNRKMDVRSIVVAAGKSAR